MKWRVLFVVAVVAAVAVGLAMRLRRHPNVLLITIDTLRQDRLHCYGYGKDDTPHLDQLAREGALFKNAFCNVTWTTPSLASTLTGSYSLVHGLKSTYEQLPDEDVTLAEVLRQHGYQTGAVVGSFPASSIFGLGQGFQTYDEHFDTPIVRGGEHQGEAVPLEFHKDISEQREFQYLKAQSDAYRPDSAVTDVALQWVQAHRGQPFFLWAHYFGPHEKMDQSRPFFDEVNRAIAAYDGDVATSDREVGRLLDGMRSLGVLDDTVVIVHADHGQSLNEHDYFGHGKYLYDEVLRIPLIIRYPPRLRAGTVVDALARNIDIFPTVLDALRISEPTPAQGRSLLTLAAGSREGGAGETYCQTYLSATEGFAEQRVVDGKEQPLGFRHEGVRTARWMFIRNDPWPFIDVSNPPPIRDDVRAAFTSEELYDMVDDPGQRVNLIERNAAMASEMRARLKDYAALERTPAARHELDDASRERLRSLGYMR